MTAPVALTMLQAQMIYEATGEARTFAYVADGAVLRTIAWALRDLKEAVA